MPKKGWKTVTISEELWKKGEKFIIDYNYKKGMKAIKSMAHLTQLALSEYFAKQKKGESKN